VLLSGWFCSSRSCCRLLIRCTNINIGVRSQREDVKLARTLDIVIMVP